MLSAIPSSSILPLSLLAPLPPGRGVLPRALPQGPLIAILLRPRAAAYRSSCLFQHPAHVIEPSQRGVSMPTCLHVCLYSILCALIIATSPYAAPIAFHFPRIYRANA